MALRARVCTGHGTWLCSDSVAGSIPPRLIRFRPSTTPAGLVGSYPERTGVWARSGDCCEAGLAGKEQG